MVNEEVSPRSERVLQDVQVPQVEQVLIDNQGNEVPVVPMDMVMRNLEDVLLLQPKP